MNKMFLLDKRYEGIVVVWHETERPHNSSWSTIDQRTRYFLTDRLWQIFGVEISILCWFHYHPLKLVFWKFRTINTTSNSIVLTLYFDVLYHWFFISRWSVNIKCLLSSLVWEKREHFYQKCFLALITLSCN